uniref:Uncharacterized protein n=1 Tax=Phlebotomus papatasi TaxID=29031 RepID=A0A1B0D949_PHLPP
MSIKALEPQELLYWRSAGSLQESKLCCDEEEDSSGCEFVQASAEDTVTKREERIEIVDDGPVTDELGEDTDIYQGEESQVRREKRQKEDFKPEELVLYFNNHLNKWTKAKVVRQKSRVTWVVNIGGALRVVHRDHLKKYHRSFLTSPEALPSQDLNPDEETEIASDAEFESCDDGEDDPTWKPESEPTPSEDEESIEDQPVRRIKL